MIAGARTTRRPVFSAALFLLLASVAGAPARDLAGLREPARVMVVDGSPVHDAGNVRVHASNWGAIGSWPGSGLPFSNAPSCEWPAGSRVEYLFFGGLWVGALLDGVPAVSTSATEFEFRPTSDPRDIVYRAGPGDPGGARVPFAGADDDRDGEVDEDPRDDYDNDADGVTDEDYAAVSDQMFVRWFRDDTPEAIQIYPGHRPMRLVVREESYQWRGDDHDDFVAFTFSIQSEGPDTLYDVYLGMLVDGDVGHRDRANYWQDDATGLRTVSVDHGPYGARNYDFPYWYDGDGDGGQAPGHAGILMLDHPTDPAGVDAPESVGLLTVAPIVGTVPFEQGGPPANDFERYELMSRGTTGPDRTGDVAMILAAGPFRRLVPGEIIRFSFALVVTPRDDFQNAERAAGAYHGRWFDLDGDPNTGTGGREHQEHWYLPADTVATVSFGVVSATADEGVIVLRGSYLAGMGVHEVAAYRGPGDGTGFLERLGTVPPCNCGVVQFMDRAVTPGRSYRYQFGVTDGEGEHLSPVVTPTAGPVEARLSQNRPNPFNPRTTIRFTLPAPAGTTLIVYTVSGERVRTLVNGELAKGPYEAVWDGLDDNGQPVVSGLYVYRLESGTFAVSRKMMLLK